MLKKSYKANQKGMSLVEVLVSIGLLGIGMLAMMSFMSVQNRENKALVESLSRNDMQRFVSSVLSDGSVCTAELANPTLFDSSKTAPYTINIDDLSSNEIAITKLHSSAKSTAPVFLEKTKKVNIGPSESLYVSDIKIKNFMSMGEPDKYTADLEISLDSSKLVRPLKPATTKLIIVTNGGPNTAKVINSCVLSEKLDAKNTCLNLGGQWLEATETGRFMAIPRCNMTDDIYLNVSENPDGVPVNGTSTSDGVAITECYYGATKNTTYRCVTRVGSNYTADVCAYDSIAKQWKVIKYVNGAPTTTVRKICTRGVLASKKSSGYTVLNFDEPLEEAIPSLASADWFQKTRYLQTVTQCRIYSRTETWKTCKNPVSPEAALQGDTGTCVYIKNGKLSLPSGSITDNFNYYNTDNDPDLNTADYTGWIYVNSKRVFKQAAGGSLSIREARGYPCYAVEVNTENVPPEVSTGSGVPLLGTMLGSPASPARVKNCLVTSNSLYVGENPGTRNHILVCDQSSSTDPLPLDTTDINDIRDQYPKKACWYFNNVKIKDYSILFGVSSWLYITGTLPTSTVMDPGTSQFQNPSKQVIATPCNSGIEFE